ncbi:MAG: hypothetical protein ABI651_09410 [Verrucomicrobiota bacterium]
MLPRLSSAFLIGASLLLTVPENWASPSRHRGKHSPSLFSIAKTSAPEPAAEEFDPPEETIGERLFLETRFSQFFFAHAGGNVNAPLSAGDPAVDFTLTTNQPLAGPFKGQAMNCRACHLVDEFTEGPGNRAYADFARRSPIPDRGDGRSFTPRNSPGLVNATLSRPGSFFLHFDGEFPTTKDLIIGTYTGRNFGWLATEREQAIAHFGRVIREDDGTGDLAKENGGAYAVVLAGVDPAIPSEFRIPAEFRIDVATASDEQILDAAAALVEVYLLGLVFELDDNGEFDGSPYDLFLKKNHLPRQPAQGETPADYSRRLLALLNAIPIPNFVSDADNKFETHDQAFEFGTTELTGLRVFFATAPSANPSAGGVGNCIACHTAPNFTDFSFHNTGATQEEYDAVHGQGAFLRLRIPGLSERTANYDAYLPPTPLHPQATGPFITPPSLDNPNDVDLGAWNVFANPDHPLAQPGFAEVLVRNTRVRSPAALLQRAIALFKTSGLRDLGHSAPYLHTGRMDSLEVVVNFYLDFSNRSRNGEVRNGARELNGMHLAPVDIAPLAAFLRALNADYN